MLGFSSQEKGISPLIAAVLLIAFTMTIAAILATWAQSFGEERLGEAGERGESAIECPRLNLDIESADWSGSSVTNAVVWNRMEENVSNIKFVVYDNDGPTMLDLSDNTTISPGSFKKLSSETNNNIGTPERLEVHVNSEQCPDVQPIDWCEGYSNGQFNC